MKDKREKRDLIIIALVVLACILLGTALRYAWGSAALLFHAA